MPSKPLAGGLAVAAVFLTMTACSAGGSNDPSSEGPSSSDSTTTTKGEAPDTKLHRVDGKDDIKNVIVKIPTGKVSLSAASPGHEVMAQVYDPDTKTWSPPASVFKDTARFCHAIKVKSKESTIVATVSCSISLQDVDGTQSSYVLGSTDGKTWKHSDLPDATGKPDLSPTGNFAVWSSPTEFLLWNPKGTFKAVKYTQSAKTPAVGVVRSNGQLLIIKAVPGKHDTCSVSFSSATTAAPTPRLVSTTLPQAGHPKCVATSAHIQGQGVIANFEQTDTVKDDKGNKTKETTTFAYAFAQQDGKWVITS